MGYRILVVDDEDDIREMLVEYLGAMGNEVVEAGTGREALDAAAEGPPLDAALVDWTLPGIGGREVVMGIHALQPRCVLVAITGHNDDVIIMSTAGGYVDDVLRKPFSLRTLGETLQRLLK